MREYCADAFESAMCSRFRSWRFFHREFASKFGASGIGPEDLTEQGRFPVIWHTSTKYVLLLTASDGERAVYKSYRPGTSVFRTRFKFAPTTKEAFNYLLAAKLGIPTPQLLGVGETRNMGRLTGTFLVTRYAENFADGRVFVPGGKRADDRDALDAFTCEQLQLLARFHDAGFRNKGFHPGNLLVGPPDAEPHVLWIDLAGCGRFSPWLRLRQTARDLTEYFRCFTFDTEQRREFIRRYLAARRHDPPSEKTLTDAIETGIRRRKFRAV